MTKIQRGRQGYYAKKITNQILHVVWEAGESLLDGKPGDKMTQEYTVYLYDFPYTIKIAAKSRSEAEDFARADGYRVMFRPEVK